MHMSMSVPRSDAIQQLSRDDMGSTLALHCVELLTQPDSAATGVEAYACRQLRWQGCIWRNVELIGLSGMTLSLHNPELTQLAFLLDNDASRAQVRTLPEPRALAHQVQQSISVVPAGEQVWVCSEGGGPLEFSSIAFDPRTVSALLGKNISRDVLSSPRLNFSHDRIWQCARRLAEESRIAREFCGLYCESMLLTLLIEVLRLDGADLCGARSRKGGLSQRQLRLATDFIEQNLGTSVSLRDLAELTGLSVSHFSHAFKQSTGKPPHRWQLEARVRRAQALLVSTPLPLSTIATDIGFADQSHFTRVFRRVAGVTPRAWRNTHMSLDTAS